MKKLVSMFLKVPFNICVSVFFVLLVSCSESKYSSLIKEEMSKGIVQDSLFLGLKLGQSQKEFFDKCWQLNRDKIVTNGSDGFVMYVLPGGGKGDLGQAITMLFYGIFNEEKVMTGMNLQFYYDSWSLWNKSLQSDQLIHEVKDRLKSLFPGNDFISVSLNNEKDELYLKVDGNRRITIKPLDDNRKVKVKIDDLRYVLEK